MSCRFADRFYVGLSLRIVIVCFCRMRIMRRQSFWNQASLYIYARLWVSDTVTSAQNISHNSWTFARFSSSCRRVISDMQTATWDVGMRLIWSHNDETMRTAFGSSSNWAVSWRIMERIKSNEMNTPNVKTRLYWDDLLEWKQVYCT